MSERTLSPGMDHFTPFPQRRSLDDGLTSPRAGQSEPVKRKWSPHHSTSSTMTLTSQSETLRKTNTTSSHEGGSPRGPKRARIDESLPAQISGVDVIPCIPSIPSDRSQLPGELWQYIFTFLPPVSLGRVMCVNRTFNTLLAPDGVLPASKLAKHGALTTTDQEHLWSLSRRAFFPGMPRPLFSRSEHGTWKLIRGNGCEFCAKKNTNIVPPVSTSPWAAGPGNDYVRVIWPFAVRSCGNCLRARLQKVCLRRPSLQCTISDPRDRKRICFSPLPLPCCLPFPLHFLLHLLTMLLPSPCETNLLRQACS